MLSEDKTLAIYIYLIIFFGLDTTEKQSPLSLTVPHSLPPSMHFSSPEKSELDHSNVSKLFSTSEMEKLTQQYFSVTLSIRTANSNIQEPSSFSLIFWDSSAIWHKHWKTQKNQKGFLQAVISNLFGFLIQQLAATLQLTRGRALQGFALCQIHRSVTGTSSSLAMLHGAAFLLHYLVTSFTFS